MQSVLVPGINGFVGQHLARELHSNGLVVHGVGRETEVSPHIESIVTSYQSCDLSDPASVEQLALDNISGVINLAGIAQVGGSFANREAYYQTNVGAHTNLVERLRALGNMCRVVAVSSGAIYSNDQPLPMAEDSRLIVEGEGSPYAYSKVLMEEALLARVEAGEDIVIARPFNHTGPGQGLKFIVPDIINQALHGEEIVTGPLNTKRDYLDVRDVVRAYRLLLISPSLGDHIFNICSGTSTSRDELIELITARTGRGPLPQRTDPTLGRPKDALDLYGDHSRITAATGWQPEIALDQTIQDFIDSLTSSTV